MVGKSYKYYVGYTERPGPQTARPGLDGTLQIARAPRYRRFRSRR